MGDLIYRYVDEYVGPIAHGIFAYILEHIYSKQNCVGKYSIHEHLWIY